MVKQNLKTLVIKLLLSLVMLIVAGILVYHNFIKEEKFFYQPSSTIKTKELEDEFNLDVLENEVFKELKAVKKITTSTIENIGRENPFLKF